MRDDGADVRLFVRWDCGCVGINPLVLNMGESWGKDGAYLILRACDNANPYSGYNCSMRGMEGKSCEVLSVEEHIEWIKRLQKRTRLANSHVELTIALRGALRQTIADDWAPEIDEGGDE